jgi:hypothetical protein
MIGIDLRESAPQTRAFLADRLSTRVPGPDASQSMAASNGIFRYILISDISKIYHEM